MAIEFSPNCKTVLAGGGELELTSFKIKYEKEEIVKEVEQEMTPSSFSSFHQLPAKPSLLSTLLTSSPKLYEESSPLNGEVKKKRLRMAELKKKDQISLPAIGTSSIKYRRDGRIFASSHWDGSIKIWNKKFDLVANLE